MLFWDSLVDATGKTFMITSKLYKIFHDSSKNLHAYILFDAGKFSKILSCIIENFHELWLKLSKVNCNDCNVDLYDFVKIMKIISFTLHNIRAIKFLSQTFSL